PHLAFGSYLSRIGKDAMAEEAYLKALRYIESETKVQPSVFYEVARYYTKRERFEEALRIIQQGIMMFPEHAGLRYNAGMLYERLDMTYRAIDAYRKALHIDPAHREAKQRLSILAPEKDNE
ncbi:MAG: tetratricopeptide repeat protein, partial [Nitrospirota bacterium]